MLEGELYVHFSQFSQKLKGLNRHNCLFGHYYPGEHLQSAQKLILGLYLQHLFLQHSESLEFPLPVLVAAKLPDLLGEEIEVPLNYYPQFILEGLQLNSVRFVGH